MKWRAKIKAGALQFVITIGVLVALLLSAFVLLSYTHSVFKLRTENLVSNINEVDKAIQNALISEVGYVENNTMDDVSILRSQWGLFDVITGIAKTKSGAYSKSVLAGGGFSSLNRTALYLSDQKRPLVVVGHTRITGNVFIPEQGVKTGSISGESLLL